MANPNELNGTRAQISTATASSWAATCHADVFKITSESLTTAAAAEYTLTLTNRLVTTNSLVLVSVAKWTSTQWTLATWEAKVSAWSVVITVTNTHASEALNGTIVISWVVVNPLWV